MPSQEFKDNQLLVQHRPDMQIKAQKFVGKNAFPSENKLKKEIQTFLDQQEEEGRNLLGRTYAIILAQAILDSEKYKTAKTKKQLQTGENVFHILSKSLSDPKLLTGVDAHKYKTLHPQDKGVLDDILENSNQLMLSSDEKLQKELKAYGGARGDFTGKYIVAGRQGIEILKDSPSSPQVSRSPSPTESLTGRKPLPDTPKQTRKPLPALPTNEASAKTHRELPPTPDSTPKRKPKGPLPPTPR